jgi:hypothetical protein
MLLVPWEGGCCREHGGLDDRRCMVEGDEVIRRIGSPRSGILGSAASNTAEPWFNDLHA